MGPFKAAFSSSNSWILSFRLSISFWELLIALSLPIILNAENMELIELRTPASKSLSVPPTGFEPVITGMKTQRPNH